jgi:hypothetical protein
MSGQNVSEQIVCVQSNFVSETPIQMWGQQ